MDGPGRAIVFYLRRWDLVPDGELLATRSSHLLPVLRHGRKAMLKLALAEEERAGAALMVWWGGDGAAPVLEHEGCALLMERAAGPRSLAEMSRTGQDDEACAILCAAAARLHRPRLGPRPKLVPLEHWFEALIALAPTHGGLLDRCETARRALLAAPQEVVALHGDLHHDNVLDFGAGGWLAIDPKGLLGERGFDFANIFCNPDLAPATDPLHFARRLALVAKAAQIEHKRLLLWILAWSGLSTAFFLQDGENPPFELRQLTELAAAS